LIHFYKRGVVHVQVVKVTHQNQGVVYGEEGYTANGWLVLVERSFVCFIAVC